MLLFIAAAKVGEKSYEKATENTCSYQLCMHGNMRYMVSYCRDYGYPSAETCYDTVLCWLSGIWNCEYQKRCQGHKEGVTS